ncbi:MAG: hypothetical protein JOZ52_08560 [Acidobacteria bacterium]|nr:hypothetical protein [Acidobacteriota bacterium]
MAAVDLTRCQKRVIELLVAAGRAARYTAAVGDNSRYAVTQEITDAIIEADLIICRDIIETAGHPYAAQFMGVTGNLANGDLIPAFMGVVADVYVDDELSSLASSRDEILEIRANAALYPNVGAWHFIENSILYHTGTNGVVRRPVLARDNAACQAHEAYEEADVVGAISLLAKDGAMSGDSFYQYHNGLFLGCRQMIRQKVLIVPEQTRYEKAAA